MQTERNYSHLILPIWKKNITKMSIGVLFVNTTFIFSNHPFKVKINAFKLLSHSTGVDWDKRYKERKLPGEYIKNQGYFGKKWNRYAKSTQHS